jgi:hypothetical protein
VQEVPHIIIAGDPAHAAAVQGPVVDVPVHRRHEDRGAAGVEHVVVVDVRQALVGDPAGPAGGIERKLHSSPFPFR